MAFRPTTTKQTATANGLKVLCYGPAGSGKTVLCATTGCPSKTLIISCEGGLLSIRNAPEMAVAEVKTMADLDDVYDFLVHGEHEFQWVCLDSISEIAEVVLTTEKGSAKDGRAAYGNLADIMFDRLRKFRDLALNVYMSAKQTEITDEGSKRTRFMPSLPGRTLTQGISYLFDEVFAIRINRDEDGEPKRWLLTNTDGSYEAKDRSGSLNLFEAPNLANIHAKIMGDGHE